MEIKSFGRRTDLIFSKFAGQVQDRGNYLLIRTPSNPDFHWGNYIIFDRPPRKGDLAQWVTLFNSEFPCYEEPHHYVFTWDCENNHKGEYEEFLDNNFELDSGVVLMTTKLKSPPHANKEIEVRKLSSDKDWRDAFRSPSELC